MLVDEIEPVNAQSGPMVERAVRLLKKRKVADGGRRKALNIIGGREGRWSPSLEPF
jgi:hypothetical protein